jgi:hypothetical protein
MQGPDVRRDAEPVLVRVVAVSPPRLLSFFRLLVGSSALLAVPRQRHRVREQALDVPVLHDEEPLPAALRGEHLRDELAGRAHSAVHDAGVPAAWQGTAAVVSRVSRASPFVCVVSLDYRALPARWL